MRNLQVLLIQVLMICVVVAISVPAAAYNPLYPCECPIMENTGPDCDPDDFQDRNCGEMAFRVFYNSSEYIVGPKDYDGDPDHISSPPIDNRFPVSTEVNLTFYNPSLDGTDYDFLNWDSDCTGLEQTDMYWAYEHYLSAISGPGTLTPCCEGAPGPEATWITPSSAGHYTISSTINDEVGGIPPWSCTYSSEMWYNDSPVSRQDDVVVEEHWVYSGDCEDFVEYGGDDSVTIDYVVLPDSGWMPDGIELWFIQEGGGTGEAKFDVTGKGLGQQQFIWHGYTPDAQNPAVESDVLVPVGTYRVYVTMYYGPYGVHTLKKSQSDGSIRRIYLMNNSLNLSISGLDEADEDSPGLFLKMNDDDDNNNSIPDYLENYVAGENDLVALTVSAAAGAPDDTVLRLKEIGVSGSLKLWTEATKGLGSEVDISGTGYTLLNSNLPITFYMEGYSAAATPNPTGVKLELCSLDDFGDLGDLDDRILVDIGGLCDVDLDEDSNNDNTVFPYEPDHSYIEDIKENDPQEPGRYIDVNDDDDDDDGIPDYVDGYNLDDSAGSNDDDRCADEDDFILITFDIKQLPGIPICFDVTYTESPPDSATYSPPSDPVLPSGGIRIWKYSEGLEPRDKRGMLQQGDYLAPGTYPTTENFVYSGYYVEGVLAGEYYIKFKVNVDTDDDGTADTSCEDIIKVTVR